MAHRDSRDPSQRPERWRSWLEDAPWTRRREEDDGDRDRSERHGQGDGGQPRDAYAQGGYRSVAGDRGGLERDTPRGTRESGHVDRGFSLRSPFRQREYAPDWQGDDRFSTGVFSASGADPDFRSGGGQYEVEDWGSHMGWGADQPRRARGGAATAVDSPLRRYGDDREPRHGDEDRSRAFAQPRRGGFRGLGPRNYTRSDQRIAEDLCERLTEDDEIDARGIEVQVSEGVVTLSGSVAERAMKHRAEDLAEHCTGVRDVENRIRVTREDGQREPGRP